MNLRKEIQVALNNCQPNTNRVDKIEAIAKKFAEHYHTLQLQQCGVSGSLFSEINTEMLKISVAIQNIQQSEFIEDYNFHKTTSKKDIRGFLNSIKQQNERLVIVNQRIIRLRERFGSLFKSKYYV